ncbi:hypothetical protein EJ08DRAFT_669346 [Tothia fuscella]|uniref:CENP-V/GFA domain-containing protein n=1 Tax=Tothia fuscella TaxID=1048955 RepID=A0A9P4U0L7_9PEZI|nr:hypothetical protein EJ08DRAFT_669346 [Tothia fuscella]
MEPKTKLPVTITGSCLCEAIRYTITFPTDAEWPPKFNATCQCTKCRKFTGSLLPQGHVLPRPYITPAINNTTFATYTSFQSSEHCYRSFCSKCGSSLTFHDETKPDVIEIYLGTLDEDVLCKRDGGVLGEELCKSGVHIWVGNGVKGVSDGERLEGVRWKGDRGGEEMKRKA